MARITGEQFVLLETLVDAYWSNDPGEPKEDFMFYTTFGGTTMSHRVFGDDEQPLDVGDLEELSSLGLVSIDYSGQKSGNVRPTADGKRAVEEQGHVQEITRTDRAISGGGPGVSWKATLPILEAIVGLYDQADAGEDVSQMDVCNRLGRPEGDPGVSRAFEVLERSGYVEKRWEIDQVPGPLTVAPTEKALQLIADWPASGAAALEKLLAILDQRIANAPDEEQKGKLRIFRDSVVDVGESIAAEVLVKLMTGS